MELSRRDYLSSAGAAGAIAIAGCSDEGGTRTTYDAQSVSVPEEVSSYLSNAEHFDGTAVDLTDRDEVEVLVGTEGNSNYYAYSPVAIQISTGTTVVWSWTGRGGAHNVVSEGDAFRSGSPEAGSDITFSNTFSEPGNYRYLCTPHERYGMKGAVVVV